MNWLHLNPYVRYCRKHTRGYTDTAPRICYDCRFYYVENGSGSLVTAEHTFRFSAGCAIFLPFGTTYRFIYDTPNILICAVNFDLFDCYTEFSESLRTPYASECNISKILSYKLPDEFSTAALCEKMNFSAHIAQMCELFITQQPHFRERIGALLKLCLLDFAEQTDFAQSSKLVNDVLQYIYREYAIPELSNETIARHFGYHSYYLNSLVKHVTGRTLHRQITDYRLSVAVHLLSTSEEDVKTIAWKTGFRTVSYFIKMFREKYGLTPHRYRKLYHVL